MSRNLARETSIGILIVLGMLLYRMARFPASLAYGGQLSFLAIAAALLVYLGLILWAARRPATDLQTALHQSAVMSALLRLVAMANLALELFGNLNAAWTAITGVSQ